MAAHAQSFPHIPASLWSTVAAAADDDDDDEDEDEDEDDGGSPVHAAAAFPIGKVGILGILTPWCSCSGWSATI